MMLWTMDCPGRGLHERMTESSWLIAKDLESGKKRNVINFQ